MTTLTLTPITPGTLTADPAPTVGSLYPQSTLYPSSNLFPQSGSLTLTPVS